MAVAYPVSVSPMVYSYGSSWSCKISVPDNASFKLRIGKGLDESIRCRPSNYGMDRFGYEARSEMKLLAEMSNSFSSSLDCQRLDYFVIFFFSSNFSSFQSCTCWNAKLNVGGVLVIAGTRWPLPSLITSIDE